MAPHVRQLEQYHAALAVDTHSCLLTASNNEHSRFVVHGFQDGARERHSTQMVATRRIPRF